MADIDIAQERVIADAATPGPWFTPDERRLQGAVSARIGERECQVASIDGDAAMFDRRAETHEIQRANATFIARARTLVPRLLDALEQASKERDGNKAAIDMLDAEANGQMERNIELRTERDALRAELERVKAERDEAVRREQLHATVLDIVRDETAEAIAAWLDDWKPDYMLRRDYGVQNDDEFLDRAVEMVASQVRAGAWRAKEGR